jgi:type I restriction enzyme M protein
MSEFASWLVATRKQKKLSQAQLAERVGVTQAQVSQWESGKVKPKTDVLKQLEKVLGAAPRGSKAPPPARSSEPSTNGRSSKPNGSNGASILGFEQKLWETADKLRGSMDPGEYKHVVLGLIFLKYISDAFDERYAELRGEEDADPEDRDEYEAANVFWVPKQARWTELQKAAKQPTIGVLVDKAMESIEKENPSLKGTLPKEYARPALDKQRLGEIIDLMSGVALLDPEHRTKDILGRVYEYFLAKFASAEGRLGGDFYTPQSVVRVLVEMLEPTKGRVYDPCCGSGGMFVQSKKFVEAHGGKLGDISVFGQEWNPTTWRLAKMNLAIRGIEANLGPEWANTFQNDLHKGLKADFVLANPPFNVSDWGGEHLRDDVRWAYGVPPVGNANFAWLQHIVHHLAPSGTAGVVLANGSMSSPAANEGVIRKNLVEADIVDCMVALPPQLFYATQIPVCLWFLARNKADRRFRDRRSQVLFIDARRLGTMTDRTHREFTNEDVARVATTYHAWRGEIAAGQYEDVPGFCRSVATDEIRAHEHTLNPGRYVGAQETSDDDEPFDEKMQRMTTELQAQFSESRSLETKIVAGLRRLGYAL